MKFLKILGLAAVAMMALMAFVVLLRLGKVRPAPQTPRKLACARFRASRLEGLSAGSP
jgi:hypothetical protein